MPAVVSDFYTTLELVLPTVDISLIGCQKGAGSTTGCTVLPSVDSTYPFRSDWLADLKIGSSQGRICIFPGLLELFPGGLSCLSFPLRLQTLR